MGRGSNAVGQGQYLGWQEREILPNLSDFTRIKTRLDTQKESHGPLGRGCNAKTARNSRIFRTDSWTNRNGMSATKKLQMFVVTLVLM